MENNTRKASEVLLELESKLNLVLNLLKAQDLNIKILSNKLNSLMNGDAQKSAPAKPSAEAVHIFSPLQQVDLDADRQIPISSEAALPLEDSPSGFRRTSRPETFSGDNTYLVRPEPEKKINTTVQMNRPPPGRTTEAVLPVNNNTPTEKVSKNKNVVQNAVPVLQRVVDKGGKSVFLADVEIIDLSTMDPVYKTRTNGTGKWMASLPIGDYRIIINKRESLSKEKIQVSQDIQVDGSSTKVELQTLIIK